MGRNDPAFWVTMATFVHRDISDDIVLTCEAQLYESPRLVLWRRDSLEGWIIADQWVYLSDDAAVAAMRTWDPLAGGEPPGWYRHPTSGRRRTNGDPAQEYILL